MALAPMFWAKLAYCAALAGAALALAVRMARPGARTAGAASMLAVPLLVMWLLAVVALGGAAGSERDALVFGTTWRACAFSIAFLSLPLFAGAAVGHERPGAHPPRAGGRRGGLFCPAPPPR